MPDTYDIYVYVCMFNMIGVHMFLTFLGAKSVQRCGDKTILGPCYIHNGIVYTDKTT